MRIRFKPPSLKLLSLFISNAAVYASAACYYCFVQIYLSKTHSEVAVGSLLSVGQIIAVFAPVIWGIFADKSKYKNTVLCIASAGYIISYYLVMVSDSYLYLAIVISFVMFFLSSFGGLIDTITIEYAYKNDYKYGTIRVFGTIAYGIVAFGLAILIEKDINMIFHINAALSLLTCVFILTAPKIKGHAHVEHAHKDKENTGVSAGERQKKFSLKPIFADNTLVWMMILQGVAQFT